MSSNEKRPLRTANNERRQISLKSSLRAGSSQLTEAVGSSSGTGTANVEKSIGCDLTDEVSAEDEQLILKHVNMSAEDLKLQKENKDLFWQRVAESVRDQLSETLDDNQQVVLILLVLLVWLWCFTAFLN